VHVAGDHLRAAVGHESQVIQRRREAVLGARVGHVAQVRGHVRVRTVVRAIRQKVVFRSPPVASTTGDVSGRATGTGSGA
jgi:hypothetical protein